MVHIGVIGLDGKTIASTDSWRLGKIEFENMVKKIHDGPTPLTFITSNFYETLIPVYNAGRPSPVAVIYIGFSQQAVVLKIINTIKYVGVLYFVFLLISSVMISILIRRFVTHPISELSKAATNLANGNLSTNIPRASSYEVGLLADSFANMSNSIAETLDSMKESEDKFRTLVGNIPGTSYRCASDEHRTIEFISNNVEILSGYPVTDFIQNAVRSYASIIHSEDQQMVEDNVMEGVRQKKSYTIEYRIVKADDTISWVFEKGQGIFDEQGNLQCLDGVIVDITDRKQAEEEFGKIFDLSVDMICIADVTTGYFKRINPAFGKTLGYSDEELLGKPFYDFIHPDDIDSTTKVAEGQLVSAKRIIGFENRYRCKDGSFKWFMWTANPIPERGITSCSST